MPHIAAFENKSTRGGRPSYDSHVVLLYLLLVSSTKGRIVNTLLSRFPPSPPTHLEYDSLVVLSKTAPSKQFASDLLSFNSTFRNVPSLPLPHASRSLSSSSLRTPSTSSTTVRSTPPTATSLRPPSIPAPLPAPLAPLPFSPSPPRRPISSLSPLQARSTSPPPRPLALLPPLSRSLFPPPSLAASFLSLPPFSSPTSPPVTPTSPPYPKPALSTSGGATPPAKSPPTRGPPSTSRSPRESTASAAWPAAAITPAWGSRTACSSGPASSRRGEKRPSGARSRSP